MSALLVCDFPLYQYNCNPRTVRTPQTTNTVTCGYIHAVTCGGKGACRFRFRAPRNPQSRSASTVAGEVEVANEVWAECGAYHDSDQCANTASAACSAANLPGKVKELFPNILLPQSNNTMMDPHARLSRRGGHHRGQHGRCFCGRRQRRRVDGVGGALGGALGLGGLAGRAEG